MAKKANKRRNPSKDERNKRRFENEDYDPQFERKLRKFLRDSAINLAQLKKNRERKQR